MDDMEMIENRGRELLNRWLSGDITYHEELELFEIAASDSAFQDALEGYLGEENISAGELPVAVEKSLNPRSDALVAEAPNNVRTLVWVRYAAAALVLLMAVGFLFSLLKNEGQLADPVMVEINQPERQGQFPNEDEVVVADAESVSNLETADAPLTNTVESSDERLQNQVEPILADGDAKEDLNVEEDLLPGMDAPIALVVQEVIDESSEELTGSEDQLLPEEDSDLLVNDGSESFSEESDVAVLNKSDKQADHIEMEVGKAMQFFDYEADELLKREVELEALKEGDKPITAYEIDIKSGISPDNMEELSSNGSAVDTATIDPVGLQSKTNMADASNENKGVDNTNVIANNVVITSYKIQKRDITHPPIEDYNSLVREKYKRKAKPETGFFHYKKYLKQATGCLIDEFQNVDYLEEAIIKFRVFNNGDIEFIELFGTDGGDCVDHVSSEIIAGPRWDVADHYESIDVEIPFKVLYPYWY